MQRLYGMSSPDNSRFSRTPGLSQQTSGKFTWQSLRDPVRVASKEPLA